MPHSIVLLAGCIDFSHLKPPSLSESPSTVTGTLRNFYTEKGGECNKLTYNFYISSVKVPATSIYNFKCIFPYATFTYVSTKKELGLVM